MTELSIQFLQALLLCCWSGMLLCTRLALRLSPVLWPASGGELCPGSSGSYCSLPCQNVSPCPVLLCLHDPVGISLRLHDE